jgi:hypothetical protein
LDDAPGRLVIRPDPRRYWRVARTGAPLVVLATVVVAVRVERELDWLVVPTVAALVGPPALVLAGYAVRHSRTVRLTAMDGLLDLTDWRGRRHTLRRPLAVLYCTMYSGGGRMEHIVIGGPLTEIPLVLRTRQWRPADLAAVWERIGVRPRHDDLTSAPGVRSRFPAVPLPYSTRYPMTVGLLCALAAFGYIALVMSLFRAVADA